MLVLSRKINEKILIGDDIVISIVRLEGNQVRLGIAAPPQVRILRSEISETPGPNGRPRTWGGSDVSDFPLVSPNETGAGNPPLPRGVRSRGNPRLTS